MKRKLLFTLGCLVGLATLSYGAYAWYNAITYVSTDDAYVEGTISPVSADASRWKVMLSGKCAVAVLAVTLTVAEAAELLGLT